MLLITEYGQILTISVLTILWKTPQKTQFVHSFIYKKGLILQSIFDGLSPILSVSHRQRRCGATIIFSGVRMEDTLHTYTHWHLCIPSFLQTCDVNIFLFLCFILKTVCLQSPADKFCLSNFQIVEIGIKDPEL